MTIKTSVKNGLLFGNAPYSVSKNKPKQYEDRQKQYFDNETAAFIKQYARYSSDFTVAKVQGLEPDNPKAWKEYRIRMADAILRTSMLTRKIDDFKLILFEDPSIDYVPEGTKVVTMGSTWLVVNPNNIAGVSATAIMRRCRAVWNRLDYYGNVLSEPIIVDKFLANANQGEMADSMPILGGYFNVICQYNEATAQLDTNSRIILGSKAYKITGYSDFMQEFTNEYDSVRLLEFSVRMEEPNLEIDDMEKRVAGGKQFSWEILAQGSSIMKSGSKQQLTVISRRNGEVVAEADENPITYIFDSSDESVAEVDAFGNITAVSDGECIITLVLAQNPLQRAAFTLNVVSEADNYVEFLEKVPSVLRAFSSITVSAAYYEQGVQTEEPVTWSFEGTPEDAYRVDENGNQIVITCFAGSEKPLVVQASHGDYKASISIGLEGI